MTSLAGRTGHVDGSPRMGVAVETCSPRYCSATMTHPYVYVSSRRGGRTMPTRSRHTPMNFAEMPQGSVPQGRNGKHKAIVTKILSDLDQMAVGKAIRVPLAGLGETKERVR